MKAKSKLILMTAAAVAGVSSTAILSFKAGKKFDSLYEMYIAELNYSSDSKAEVFKRYLPKFIRLFTPAFGAAAATIAMIVLMSKFSIKAQATLMAGLAIAETRLDLLNNKGDQLASDQESEFLNMVSHKEKFEEVSEDDVLLYEPYTGVIFTTTKEKFDKALKRANKKLQNNYIVRISSILCDMAGHKAETEFGINMGWEMDNEVQMHLWKKLNGPVISISLNKCYKVHGRDLHRIDWNVAPRLIVDRDS